MHEVGVALEVGELGELGLDGGGSAKEKTGVGFQEHGGVVEGVASGDDEIIQAFQGGDGTALGVGLTHFVAGDSAVRNDEAVAENGGPFQLAHEGLGKFFEGVGEDDDLGEGAELAQEIEGAVQRFQGGNRVLDVGEFEAVLIEDFEAAEHEFVVVGLVAGGAAEFGEMGFFGDGNPDFRHEHAFQVQDDNGLFHGAIVVGLKGKCKMQNAK